MKCLDLYCGAGGAGQGYYLAGFDVTGVDIIRHTNHPKHMNFIKADALEVLKDKDFVNQFDLIHASPVCKRYSVMSISSKTKDKHPDEIPEVRRLLKLTGKYYVIENVPGAPLLNYVVLCGTMFGLNIIRHRLFECNPMIVFPPFTCNHQKKVVKHGRQPDRLKNYAAVTGHFTDVEFAKLAMGIDWMNRDELSLAIPPAYTKWIGEKMKSFILQNLAV